MRRALLLLSAVTVAGCHSAASSQHGAGDLGGETAEDLSVSATEDLSMPVVPNDGGGGGGGDLSHSRIGPQTVTLTLDAGVFPPTPSHPSALVYIPSHFDPTPPLNVIVYIHGFSNCVTNIVRDAGGTCSDGGVVRDAYSLAAQLEASGKNALFLAPEVEFEQASGNAGGLSNKATFMKLLSEVLADLQPQLGTVTPADVGELIVASHSGGYTAADDIVDSTGVNAREIWMLDSIYDSNIKDDFVKWVKQDLGTLLPPPYRRFATFYTIIPGPPPCQGTDCNSENMAATVAALYPPDAGVVLDEPNSAVTWTEDQYRHGMLCKHSSLAHNDIPRYYFVHLLDTSALPNK
jgi:hypothetical protein